MICRAHIYAIEAGGERKGPFRRPDAVTVREAGMFVVCSWGVNGIGDECHGGKRASSRDRNTTAAVGSPGIGTMCLMS
jgi:hypothetical protein